MRLANSYILFWIGNNPLFHKLDKKHDKDNLIKSAWAKTRNIASALERDGSISVKIVNKVCVLIQYTCLLCRKMAKLEKYLLAEYL